MVKTSQYRDSLTLLTSPGENRNQPENTGKCPDYTSDGGKKIFAADARHNKNQSRDEETNQSN
jgi:hypothetical protein